MLVELKNFYPVEIKKHSMKGGLHVAVKLADNIEINLRGILASRQKEKYFFRLAFKNGIDHKKGTTVSYPIFLFTDPVLNKTLIDEIYRLAPAFIENWIKENPQASTIPAMESAQASETSKALDQAKPQVKAIECNGSDSVQKKPDPIKSNPFKKSDQAETKTSPVSSIAKKQWVDLPPRPAKTKAKAGYSHARR